MSERLRLLFLNVAHTYDHWFMLIFATAVIAVERQFALSYGELMALSTPGFLAFGLGAIPAGWLGDRWSREGMIALFFLGIGAACILTSFARTPLEIAVALTLLGIFAAIYHPVGIAMVAEGASETLGRRLGINGVWGNMGVAGAALVTGAIIDLAGWRAAFLLPGLLAILTGLGYLEFLRRHGAAPRRKASGRKDTRGAMRVGWRRVLTVVAVATLMGSMHFNATTVAMPKVLEERLIDLVTTTAGIGIIASAVYATAAFVQILAGLALDRFPARLLLMSIAAGQVVAMVVAAVSHGWIMVAAAVAVMILVFAQIPINTTLIARYTPESIRARVYGFQFLVVFGIGGLAVPMIAVLHGQGGFVAMFLVLAVFASVTCAAATGLPRRGKDTVAVAASRSA